MNITDRNDRLLKFSCPHCWFEYLTIGVDADRLPDCLCPVCGGWCEITPMSYPEIWEWINHYKGSGESADA
jgi:transcription elongation factor Elf1